MVLIMGERITGTKAGESGHYVYELKVIGEPTGCEVRTPPPPPPPLFVIFEIAKVAAHKTCLAVCTLWSRTFRLFVYDWVFKCLFAAVLGFYIPKHVKL